MKKILLTIIFCGLTFITKSQNTSVEKSIYGIQTGVLGIWVHNETKLTNSIALRSEIGLNLGIRSSISSNETEFIATPVITIEPRLYYNLNKRAQKSKRIDGNSGNFISLSTNFHPNWFVISNNNNIDITSAISIIPTWGLKRNIGKHFNYETGIGIGYGYVFRDQNNLTKNSNELAAALNIRIGYRF